MSAKLELGPELTEIRNGLATEAHRLLFDRFISDFAANLKPVQVRDYSKPVEAERLNSLRESDDHRRKLLAGHLCIKADSGWNTVLDLTTESLDMLADLQEAIGIESGGDPVKYVAEVRALCARGRGDDVEPDPEERISPTQSARFESLNRRLSALNVAIARGHVTILNTRFSAEELKDFPVPRLLQEPVCPGEKWTQWLTPEEAVAVCWRRALGKPYDEIAKALGIPRYKVYAADLFCSGCIARFKRTPESHWPCMIFSQVRAWEARIAEEAVAA